MSNLDAIDHEILARLSEDARMSVAALAEEVGVSRATAYRRLDTLSDLGVIRSHATVVDAAKLGLTVSALVMARVEQDHWRQARDAIRELETVKYAALVTGDRDVLIIVQATDISSLRDAVLQEINGLPSVRSTRTMLVLEEFVDRVNPTPGMIRRLTAAGHGPTP